MNQSIIADAIWKFVGIILVNCKLWIESENTNELKNIIELQISLQGVIYLERDESPNPIRSLCYK